MSSSCTYAYTCTLPSIHLSAVALISHKCEYVHTHITPQTNRKLCPCVFFSTQAWV